MGEPIVSNTKKRSNIQNINFNSSRRFGIELELNAFDGENRPPKGEKPKGIDYVANLVAAATPEEGCEIRTYEHTVNNQAWVAKPDSSCGMEVVSPPEKGWSGLKRVLKVVHALQNDPLVKSDRRCSVHLHVEIADLTPAQLASVVAWWIKCEPVIMDAMPMERKRNRYCQLIGMNTTFQHNGEYSDDDLLRKVGDVKYYSLNTNQYVLSDRKTIEFRTMEAAGCKDAYLVKQWVRFLIHFVETAANTKRPLAYHEPKDQDEKMNLTPWTGLCWLDPEHVLTFLGFNNVEMEIPGIRPAREYVLSKGMQQTRNWFLARLMRFMSNHKEGGLRYYAQQQLTKILDRYRESGLDIDPKLHLSPTELQDELIFGEQYKF